MPTTCSVPPFMEATILDSSTFSSTRRRTRAVFCRIAWMERYEGVNDGDVPRHGGQWVEDGNPPWESYNFADIKGYCYGYARPAGNGDRVNLRRIDPSAGGNVVTGATIVFFASDGTRQVVVGWYDGAEVHETPGRGPGRHRDGFRFFFKVPADRAVLLAPEERTFPIPHGTGATGQSNWTYIYDAHGALKTDDWIEAALAYVAGNGGPAAGLARQIAIAEQEGAFDPANIEDARERTQAAIVRRRGQPAFRAALVAAYGGKCAITGCDFEPALEAAHIVPYRGEQTNDVTNGLLLRADIHSLFDLGFIRIEPETWTVRVADALRGTTYEDLDGTKLRLPKERSKWPSLAALNELLAPEIRKAPVPFSWRMKFDWDSRKAEEVERKHGVTFEQAERVFDDPERLDELDTMYSKDGGEARQRTIGSVDGAVLVVPYTPREAEGVTRLISVWKAKRQEKERFLEHARTQGEAGIPPVSQKLSGDRRRKRREQNAKRAVRRLTVR